MEASSPAVPRSKEEYVYRGRAFGPWFEEVKEYVDSHSTLSDAKLVQYLRQKYPDVSTNQIERAIERVKTGKRRVSGTAPNLALCMTEEEMQYLAVMRNKFGSKAGIMHMALGEFIKKNPLQTNGNGHVK